MYNVYILAEIVQAGVRFWIHVQFTYYISYGIIIKNKVIVKGPATSHKKIGYIVLVYQYMFVQM